MKKKTKRYAEGGLAGIADAANSLMGDVDSMANKINYGTESGAGSTQPLGFNAVSGMKKGGQVKAGGYRKVADGIATKGKTKGRMV